MIWDKEKKKILCRFINGEYETEDTRVIKLLKEIPTVSYEEEKEPEKEIELTKKEIMSLLDEADIDYNPRDKKEGLRELLKGI